MHRIQSLRTDVNGCRMGDEIYGTDKDGYPFLKSGGIMWRAARFVLTQKLGRPIAEGLQACHSCDKPACLSADHIWEGSCADNIQDAARKGRLHTGYGHHRTLRKLQAGQVREIRNLYATGNISQAKLAAAYPVSATTIGKILNRDSWAWLY